MIPKFKIFTILTCFFALAAFTTFSVNWNIDPNYSIKFGGSKAEGTFSGLTGTVVFDPKNISSAKMDVSVAVNTIKTGNSTKDSHAKGSSWFDAEKYPSIQFSSTAFLPEGKNYAVTGNLTLHGVTKKIVIPFQFSETNEKGLFTGNFKVKRKDFGINGNFFGFAVGDDFAIELQVPVSK